MKTIYKFTLAMGLTELSIPADAKPLYVAEQGEELQLWIELDTEAARVARCFEVFGTGHDMQSEAGAMSYIGTALMLNGSFVAHVYERD